MNNLLNKIKGLSPLVEEASRRLARWEAKFVESHRRPLTINDINNDPIIRDQYKKYFKMKRDLKKLEKSLANTRPEAPSIGSVQINFLETRSHEKHVPVNISYRKKIANFWKVHVDHVQPSEDEFWEELLKSKTREEPVIRSKRLFNPYTQHVYNKKRCTAVDPDEDLSKASKRQRR